MGGRGVGGRGGAFPFKRSSMVPDIFAVRFRVRNGQFKRRVIIMPS